MKLLGVGFLSLWAVLDSADGAGERGTLTGRVQDQSGATVVGAEAKATNLESGVTQTANTTEVGAYTIPCLVPGTYRIAASSRGFSPAVAENVEFHVAGGQGRFCTGGRGDHRSNRGIRDYTPSCDGLIS